jgi:hypothetical protein
LPYVGESSRRRSPSLAASFSDAETCGAGFTFGMLPSNTQIDFVDRYWQVESAKLDFPHFVGAG